MIATKRNGCREVEVNQSSFGLVSASLDNTVIAKNNKAGYLSTHTQCDPVEQTKHLCDFGIFCMVLPRSA